MIASDRSVKSAIDDHMPAYQRCMAGAGVGVSGLDAANTIGLRYGAYRTLGQAPRPAESRIAVDDQRCQAKAQLKPEALDALCTKGAQWFTSHRASIEKLAGIVQEATTRANTVREGLH